MTSLKQRNKYVVTARPHRIKQLKSYTDDEIGVIRDTQTKNAEIQSSIQAREFAKNAQRLAKTEMSQYFSQFISENIDFRRAS